MSPKNIYPESNDFRDAENAAGVWTEVVNGRQIRVEQIAGQSGIYLVETDIATGEVIRDSRPWQMQR